MAEWNASHSRRWNHFRTLLRREYPGIEFFRGVEVQEGHRGGTARGALHDHSMTYSKFGIDKLVVRRLAIRAGFGHSVDLKGVRPGSKVDASYVAKYVTKACDSRASVPWAADVVDTSTGEVTRASVHGRYRTWSMSRGWGLTMAQVKGAAAEYARLKARQERELLEQGAMAALVAGLGPVELLTGPEPAG